MKKIILKITLWFLGITIGWVVVLKFVPVCFTPLMLLRTFESINESRPVHLYRNWVPFEQMSPQIVRAAIASEDDLFLQHHGFVWKNIRKAHAQNQKGGKLRGGSSISQQTAKNVFTFGTRTYFRKAFETYYTILIEGLWGKRRIIEVYLNVAEFGDGIYGVEAAAQRYFGRPASKLTAQQSALLVAVLPSPRKYSVTNPGPYMQHRQAQILRMMDNLPAKLDF